MRLAGKTAIITGGASGFGLGMARRFVAEGAKVLIVDIDAEKAGEAAAQIGADHVGADVAREEGIAAIVRSASALGPMDILINNAGIGHTPQPLDVLPVETFDRILAVNARSVFLLAQAFAPAMKARRSGAILNIASTGGVSPRPNLTWYNASKGWMIAATRAMAVELAPFNVRVNAINPVAGETPLLSTFMGADTPEIRAKFLASIPIGRFSTPEDIANAALYLCSDEASMVTGVALEVDGGRCI
jgi:3-oxoacyl-[acyl-carrier protein] reductase